MVNWSCVLFDLPNIILHSIAVSNPTKLANTDVNIRWSVLDVIVTRSFLLFTAIIHHMRNKCGGLIIVTLFSVWFHTTKANIFPHATSKFAVTGLVKAAACNYLRDGNRVSCIYPGSTDLPI